MSIQDVTNPKVIAFLLENYAKENRLRLNWIQNHREKIQQAATLTREPTNYYEKDVISRVMKEGMATITRDHNNSQRNRRKVAQRDAINKHWEFRRSHSITDVGLSDGQRDPRLERPDTDTTSDPVMRPVDSKLESIIYKPRPEFGRVKYLTERNKIKPEQKYYFSLTSGWDYGWRLKDSQLQQIRGFGRTWRLTRGMRSRSGPQPDPPHYKAADVPVLSKC